MTNDECPHPRMRFIRHSSFVISKLILCYASVRIASMDPAIIGRIVHDLGLPESSVNSAVALFESGAAAPFIAHYRKEQTGGLDDLKVRAIEERLAYYKDVLSRRASLVKMLTDQKRLSDELRQRIEGIFSKVELEDLLNLYRPKRKTRAAEAQEKGLEPLAEYLWNQETDAWSLEVHADAYKDPEKGVTSAEQALQGALDIIAERIAESPDMRSGLREMLWKEGQVVSTVVPAKASQKTKYTMYYDRREPVASIPSHRVLAIRRGTKEGVLTSAIECDQAKAIEHILSGIIHEKESLFAPLLEGAARDAYTRILRPLIETEVRAMLKERADREAIRVFQENLSNLLLTPPAGARVVMGIDVGKGHECRLAVVDEKGNVLEEAAISLRPPRSVSAPPATEPAPAQDSSDPGSSQAVLSDSPSVPALEIHPAEGPESDTTAVQPGSLDGPGTEAATENPAPEAAADGPDEIPIAHIAPLNAEEPASEPSPASEVRAAPAEVSPQTEPAEEVSAPAGTQEQGLETAPASETTVETAAEGEATESVALPESEVHVDAAADQIESGELTAQEPASATVAAGPAPAAVEAAPAEPPKPLLRANDIEGSRVILRDLIAKHSVRALAIASNASSRNLESMLRRILAEEQIEGIVVAAVNDAGIAIYASSRIAREELPEMNVSARCAVSLARRLQDPLAELVKIDPKLIGVGQYQHDVDQKELHRGLLQAVRSCVNRVGVDPNTAGQPLLRHVSAFNDKLARRLIGFRNAGNSFPSRSALLAIPGMDPATFEQAAGFFRIRGAENPLDRTALHPETYPVVEKMAASLGVAVSELVGNRDLVIKLKLEDFLTESTGMLTLKDVREELLRPGRDPRRPFSTPKFRADVREIVDLKEGMSLEGTVTNVTNFGAFVDVGVRQDGLVHLSQMSNRFIRDPREAVKVGDVVQVKVISVEIETKRIGLSMKALLPPPQRRRRNVPRRDPKPAGAPEARGPNPPADGTAAGASTMDNTGTDPAKPPFTPRNRNTGRRPNDNRRPAHRRDGRRRERGRPPNPAPAVAETSVEAAAPQPEEPKGPEPSLQEKIALLQSRFRGIK
jgi:protein Tex